MHTDLQINLLTNLSSDNDTSISSSPSSSTSPSLPANPPSEASITTPIISQKNSDLNLPDRTSCVIDIFDSLLEQISLGIYFDLFKSYRLNSIKIQDDPIIPFSNDVKKSESQKRKCDNSNVDIFGHSLNGIKKLECACPNCSRTLAASRLAPHLEKCMGMGRNSSRIASKRIAHFIKNSNGTNSE